MSSLKVVPEQAGIQQK